MLLYPLYEIDIRVGIYPQGLHLVGFVQQNRFVFRRDGYDVVHRYVAQHARLDLNLLGVGLPFHLGSRLKLHFVEYAHVAEHLLARGVEVTVEDQRR